MRPAVVEKGLRIVIDELFAATLRGVASILGNILTVNPARRFEKHI